MSSPRPPSVDILPAQAVAECNGLLSRPTGVGMGGTRIDPNGGWSERLSMSYARLVSGQGAKGGRMRYRVSLAVIVSCLSVGVEAGPPTEPDGWRILNQSSWRGQNVYEEQPRNRDRWDARGRDEWADRYPRETRRERQPSKTPGVSLDTAVDRVRKRTGARVLSADTVRRDGKRIHEVKFLTEKGRVRRLRVDGQSGNILPAPKSRR